MAHARKGLAGAFAAVLMVAVLVVAVPAEAARRKCFGQRVTIFATGGDEPTLGTRRSDVILGTNQNDVIDGRGGGDLICSKAGDDTVAGGKGSDAIDAGTDSGFGDTLIGGPGDDALSGGPAMNPTTFSDTGDFVSYFDGPSVNVNLDTGIATGHGTDTLINIEQAEGSQFDDVLVGDENQNVFFALGGNDTIDLGTGGEELAWPGMGNDLVRGPAGTRNMVLYDEIAGLSGVTIDLSAGTVTGAGTDTLVNITDAMGSVGNDTIIGTNGPNVLRGCSGNDTVNFGGNAATGTEPEPFINGMGVDIAVDQECFVGTAVPGNTTFTGGAGIALVCWCVVDAPINANLQTGLATGAGTDTLNNLDGVIGGHATDTIVGSTNRDFLEGTQGNDSLSGSGGQDVLVAFHMSELAVDLGAGTATGYFSGGPALSTYSFTSMEDVWGSLDNGDTLIGDNQDNTMFGMGGNDTITGNQGSDVLNGGLGTDIGDGGQGTDTCVSIETPTSCETSTARQTGRRGAGAISYGSYLFGEMFHLKR